MRIGRVRSGGQRGVDLAALLAARSLGIPTGGEAPAGWMTEDGPDPSLADFGLVESKYRSYAVRTRANVMGADGTLILLSDPSQMTGGTFLTQHECLAQSIRRGTPFCVADITRPEGFDQARSFLLDQFPAGGTLNVAGPRESKAPGIGAVAKEFLVRLFALVNAEG